MLTDAQSFALRWLQDRNNTGLFDKNGVLVAAGDRAETMRSTWNKLRDLGLATIVAKRVTLTEAGRALETRKSHRIVADSIKAKTPSRLSPRLSDEEEDA